MKCPQCRTENPNGRKFCRECGAKLVLICPQCGAENLPGDKFCGECGHQLREPAPPKEEKPLPEAQGERKYVTVLFSDLTGYTTMAEQLDPEEVKEITTRIFGQAAVIIDKYNGFVEKYAGDAVMALFGVPEAHEDDPIRAIRAAREIHGFVQNLSPEVEERVGQRLSMHTGINTGLVVTGELNMEKGTHGVAGDTINVAARLSSLAEPNSILVGRQTYQQAEGYFDFEQMDPVVVKGREKPIQTYLVISPREKPATIHRLSGLKAELIGRKAEVVELREAVNLLKEGKGRIFSICGEAGTGKSRLVQEFRESLDHDNIQWLEAHAYAYTQNISYHPLVDFFNHIFGIEEGDRHERIKEKIKSALKDLIGEREDLIPCVGSLYSLSYPELDEVSPELWKAKLQEAVKHILSALALSAPTIFFLEDLHWADPSFVELLRSTLQEARHPAIVLCVYRPEFSLFTSHQVEALKGFYYEIRLQDLSASEAIDMLESLLQTNQVPSELSRFVRDKAEGNPFYLEELINSLIESDILVKDNNAWGLAGPITESSISSTIHGIINERLDRLEVETKQVLQEASVIGRSFLFNILKRVTEIQDQVEKCLIGLERLDLIRTKTLQPDLEYIFKHALTQEVVYKGLLKKKQKEIHDRIAYTMEQLFSDRLPEFYETLAFHFSRGNSPDKAIDYLIKAGKKSYQRYSLEESHGYFQAAYQTLSTKPNRTREDNVVLIDLLIEWAYIHNNRGDFRGIVQLFESHKNVAESLGDKERLGMFYGWLSYLIAAEGKPKEGYHIGRKALELGEETGSQKIISYACAFLNWICVNLGLFEEAVHYGKRVQDLGFSHSDEDLFRFSSHALAMAYAFRGELKKTEEVGRILLDYGEQRTNPRCTTIGNIIVGYGNMYAGDTQAAINCFLQAIHLSPNPAFAVNAKVFLGMCYVSDSQIEKAENILQGLMEMCENYGFEAYGGIVQMVSSVIMLAKGDFDQGVKMWQKTIDGFVKTESKIRYAIAHNIMGRFYSQLALRTGPTNFSLMIRNIGFLMKNIPFAGKRAEDHFNKAIEVAKEAGAKAIESQACLGLGQLYKGKGKTGEAKKYILEAIRLFEESEAYVYLEQAKEALKSLE